MDNDDPTVQTVFELTQQAGVYREWVATWNIVPWYVGDGERIRGVRPDEIEEGREHLRRLLVLLPDLRVVVTMGEPAAVGWSSLASQYPLITTLTSWHASRLALNGHPERKAHLLATLHLAQQLVRYAFNQHGPRWAVARR